MNLSHRRLYFAVFIVIFILCSTTIVVYAMGWRFSRDNNTFVKVGAISVDTIPKTAFVYINDAQTKKTSPTTINNLLPNVYSVTVKKDGFQNWSTDVQVTNSTLTRLQHIHLLRDIKIDSPTFAGSFSGIGLSPNQELIAAFGNREVKIIETKNMTLTVSVAFPDDIAAVSWSPDSSNILVRSTSGKYFNLPFAKREYIDLNSFLNDPITESYWDSGNPHILIVRTNNMIYEFGTQQTMQPIASAGQSLYIDSNIQIVESASTLQVIKNQHVINTVTNTSNDELTFILVHDVGLYITAPDTQQSYFYNFRSNQFFPFSQNSSSTTYDQATQRLLILNDHEIWSMDVTNGKTDLFKRSASPLLAADWILETSYLISSTAADDLKIAEIDSIGKNVYSTGLQNCSNLVHSEKYQKLAALCPAGIYMIDY